MKITERKIVSEVRPLPQLKINDRLRVVRKSRDLTQQGMADLLKVSRPLITQLEGGRHQPSNEALETIVRELNISRNWLWFGIGSMEDNGESEVQVMALTGDVGNYADINLVTCKVRGGFIEMMDDGGSVGYESLDIVRIYDPTPEMLREGTLAFEIDGDSMEPQLRSGMKVVGVRVPLANIKYATSGVYVVGFADQLTIKRIKGNEILDRGMLVLHADNPNAGSMPVSAEDIRTMWKVVRIFYADVI